MSSPSPLRRRPAAVSIALLLSWCSVAATPVQAGLYHRPVADEILQPVASWSRFFDTVIPQLRSFAPPDPLSGASASRLRQSALQRLQEMAQRPEATLSADDYADWSGWLVRLVNVDGQSTLEPARRVLERGRARFPRDYRLAANLATVYQLRGEYDRALALLEESLTLAPPSAQEWERWHLRLLLQRRAQDHDRRIGKLPRDEAVLDDLFAIRWWETPLPHSPADRQATSPSDPRSGHTSAAPGPPSLPTQAGEVLQQLLIWFPYDGQLWWLLGEWLAARQEWSSAVQAFQSASALRVGGAFFRQRRAAVLQAAEQYRPAPPPILLPEIPAPDDPQRELTSPAPGGDGVQPARPLWSRFDWRAWTLLTVGGLLLLFLGGWQIRLWASRLFRRLT